MKKMNLKSSTKRTSSSKSIFRKNLEEWSGWLSDHSIIPEVSVELDVAFLIAILFVYISRLSNAEALEEKVFELWRVFIDYYQKIGGVSDAEYPVTITRFGRVSPKEEGKKVVSLSDFLHVKIRWIRGA
jgi:hypothetical protein